MLYGSLVQKPLLLRTAESIDKTISAHIIPSNFKKLRKSIYHSACYTGTKIKEIFAFSASCKQVNGTMPIQICTTATPPLK